MTKQVAIVGNIADGITVYGPLTDAHTVEYLDDIFDEWVVVDLVTLDEED